MRVLIFHGYPLRGTGSNVYNAELARALATAGHDVHLLCQGRSPEQLGFVDAIGEWRDDRLRVRSLGRDRPQGWGRCTVYRPEIMGLLPVYVADRYEGFTARPFGELSELELDDYLRRNVDAVRDVCALTRPECALANHMVMGPCILARALPEEVPYAVKIHGSAMEYTVRPNPRFLPHAIEGLARCATALVGSRHIAERLLDTVRIDGLEQRTFLGPPGVDVDRFVPRNRADARGALLSVANLVDALPRRGYGPAAAAATAALYGRVSGDERPTYDQVAAELAALHAGYDTAGIDTDAPRALRALAAVPDAPVVLFVGKLIVSKGVDLLLTAWPLVLREHPDAQLAIAGFGAYREGLEMLLDALSAGDLDVARQIAAGGRAFEGGDGDSLNYVIAFIDSLAGDAREAYLRAASGMRAQVHWFGRLEHDVLPDVIAAADAQVVPSTFPEAFGMVAAEAAACGVPPVCANHSGLAEVTHLLERGLPGALASMLSFDLGDRAVERLAACMNGLLRLDRPARAELAARLSETARAEFSWAGVAAELTMAARGDHSRLRRP
ncbi:MAG: glycosyltransferase family 4 protein [Thermoleophilia bacterium]|nr:glycosyltransferase family 4 protein [Thermoleophilia bacterium]